MTLAIVERHYGLMSSNETIVVTDVVGASGDLAVADRLAFIASMQRHVTIAVVELQGTYCACITNRPLSASELASMSTPEGGPRIMSLATDRGIRPALGPLVA